MNSLHCTLMGLDDNDQYGKWCVGDVFRSYNTIFEIVELPGEHQATVGEAKVVSGGVVQIFSGPNKQRNWTMFEPSETLEVDYVYEDLVMFCGSDRPLLHPQHDMAFAEVSSAQWYAPFLQDRCVMPQTSKIIFAIAIIEYLSVPGFYYAGLEKLTVAAAGGQAAFFVLHNLAQYLVANAQHSKALRDWRIYGKRPYETILGVNVERFGVSKRAFSIISNAPNTIHVLSTAVAAGASWQGWDAQKQAIFAARWRFIPGIGDVMGEIGLPGMLVLALVGSCVVHLGSTVMGRRRRDLVETLDAANMFAISNLIREQSEFVEFLWTRWCILAFVKLPMAWLSTSTFSMEYDDLDNFGRASMMVSIGLSWYAIAPQISSMRNAFREMVFLDSGLKNAPELGPSAYGFISIVLFAIVLLAIVIVGLFVLAVHFIGVFVCDSHDLSILRGCTPIMNNSSLA